MTSADWYFAQADLLRGRADACLQLAQQLDGAALFDLHRYSGDATWQCPAATEFDAAAVRPLHRGCRTPSTGCAPTPSASAATPTTSNAKAPTSSPPARGP